MTICLSETAIHFADLSKELLDPRPQALRICSHLANKGIRAYIRKGKQYWEIWRETIASDYEGEHYINTQHGSNIFLRHCNATETVLWKPCKITHEFILLNAKTPFPDKRMK